MSLPPSGWNFEDLQALSSTQSSDSEQPQEEVPQVSPKDEEYPEYPEHPVDASILPEEDSENERRRMGEAEGEEITAILTRFTAQLEEVEGNTKAIATIADHCCELVEGFVIIARNSQTLSEKLGMVEASTTEMQTSMAAMEERNRLHEVGTHNIRFNTQNIAQEAEKMGRETKLHQITMFEQQSTIFHALQQINNRLDRFKNGQTFAQQAPLQAVENATQGAVENIENLSLDSFSILVAFLLILVVSAIKYYEIIRGI